MRPITSNGTFLNPADEVAAIYRKEIDKRQQLFSIQAFAMHQMPYSASRLQPFERAFQGCWKFTAQIMCG
jgi:hypothetical protein